MRPLPIDKPKEGVCILYDQDTRVCTILWDYKMDEDDNLVYPPAYTVLHTLHYDKIYFNYYLFIINIDWRTERDR